jgi:hypothetical protein
MIDTFEQIETLLSFDDPDLFYHLQIIRRGKDHPNLAAANRTIKTYYIDNNEKLSKLKQEIIDLCEYFGARAYINLAPKSYRKCTMQCISDMAKRALDGDFKKIYKCWNTVVGYIKSDKPHWIIDVDGPTTGGCISEFIEYECEPLNYTMYYLNKVYESKIYAYIPTKNGYHIITKPFNLKQFKDKYPDIDVHKNNPTILYIPKSLD